MASIEFVQALITLWNERGHNSQKKSLEGFKEFMNHQTVSLINGQAMYSYCDVSRYLHGKDVID